MMTNTTKKGLILFLFIGLILIGWQGIALSDGPLSATPETLSNVLSVAQPGDVIQLEPGTYQGGISVPVSGITITGVENDPTQVVIEGYGTFNYSSHANEKIGIIIPTGVTDVTLQWLTIKDSEWNGIVVDQSTGNHITRCLIEDHAFAGISFEGGSNNKVTFSQVTGTQYGVATSSAPASQVSELANNNIYDNTYNVYAGGVYQLVSDNYYKGQLDRIIGANAGSVISAGEAPAEIVIWNPIVPKSPENLSAVASGHTVELSWYAVTEYTNDEVIEGTVTYEVYRGNSESSLTEKINQTPVSSTNFTYVEGDAGTYYYGVKAIIENMGSSLSVISATTIDLAPKAPANVTVVNASDETGSRVELNWDAVTKLTDENEITGEVNYTVYRGATVDNMDAVGTSDQTNYCDESVLSEGTYYYAVTAVSQEGSSAFSEKKSVSVILPIPADPASVTVEQPDPNQNLLIVRWSPVTESHDGSLPLNASYMVYRGSSIDDLEPLTASPITTFDYTDNTVESEHSYAYAVKAVFGIYESNLTTGTITTASRRPKAPASLTASGSIDPSELSVSLSWPAVTQFVDGRNISQAGFSVSYRIYRNASLFATMTNLDYVDNTIVNQGTYTYSVKAVVNGVESEMVSQDVTVGGKIATPSTINTVLASAVADDVIYLEPGTYSPFTVTTSDIMLCGMGDSPDDVIIQGTSKTGTGITVTDAQNVTLKKITVTGMEIGILLQNGSGHVLDGIKAVDNIQGVRLDNADNACLNNNTINANDHFGLVLWGGSQDAVIIWNEISENGDNSGSVPTGGAGVQIETSASFPQQMEYNNIRNNTIYNVCSVGSVLPSVANNYWGTTPSQSMFYWVSSFTPYLESEVLSLPNTPEGLVGEVNYRTVTLGWDPVTELTNGEAVEGAVIYEVYRGTSASDVTEKITETPVSSTNFTYVESDAGTYYYGVKAFVDGVGSDLAIIELELPDFYLPSPENITVTASGYDFELNWDAVTEFSSGEMIEGTVTYEIYRKLSQYEPFEKITEAPIADVSFSYSENSRRTYYYGIKALVNGMESDLAVVVVDLPEYEGPEWYVDADAPEGGYGALDAPFRKIQQAVDAARNGDEIRILPGTYEGIIEAEEKENILITGWDPEANQPSSPNSVVIDCAQYDFDHFDVYFSKGMGLFVQNLTFQNMEMGIWVQDHDDFQIKNVRFISCHQCIYILEGSLNSVIQDCTFEDSFSGLDIRGGSNNAKVYRNSFINIEMIDLSIDDSDGFDVRQNTFESGWASCGNHVSVSNSDGRLNYNNILSEEFSAFSLSADDASNIDATKNYFGTLDPTERIIRIPEENWLPFSSTEINIHQPIAEQDLVLLYSPVEEGIYVAPDPAAVENYNVGAPRGSNLNPYSLIQDAVDVAQTYDVITLLPGTYENQPLENGSIARITTPTVSRSPVPRRILPMWSLLWVRRATRTSTAGSM